MPRMIWKFPLKTDGHQPVEMPNGAILLTVAEQFGAIWLWAEVDPDEPKVNRNIFVYATGHAIPDDPGEFVGSVLLLGGSLVFHIYGGR